MDKKAYIAPSMEAVPIDTEEMIATSQTLNTFSISDETTEDDANMAGERRSGWGDLWN